MGKRPRIKFEDKSEELFKLNCASENAKFLYLHKDFEIEIWIDKHYQNRLEKGDENGKREGIEEDAVMALIIESFKYIFHFYIKHKHVSFINFFNKEKPTKYRIVVKDENNLNVVLEIHFLDYSKYEITIITAMKVEEFKLSDGQYILSIGTQSIKFEKFANKQLSKIDKIDL